MRVSTILRMNWLRGKVVSIVTSSKGWKTGSEILYKMTTRWMKKRTALKNRLKVVFWTIRKLCLLSQTLDCGK